MISHLFHPGIDLLSLTLLPEHKEFLRPWLEEVRTQGADGNIAASMCLSGLMVELALEKTIITDWMSIMQDFLTEDSRPVAYSQAFGRRVHKFDAQWKQSPIHAIHARWWVEKTCSVSAGFDYVTLIRDCLQPSGWIYNHSDSETRIRNRMRSELMMSQVMGIEILKAYDAITEIQQDLTATLADEAITVFLSAESYRLQALELLDAANQAPANLGQVITGCQVDAEDEASGFCDFSPRLKIADYMGTAHRSARDIAKASPMSGLYAKHLAESLGGEEQIRTEQRLYAYAQHLKNNPLEIEAFHIRDLRDIPFGEGCTVLELLAASALIQNFGTK